MKKILYTGVYYLFTIAYVVTVKLPYLLFM